MPRRESWKEQLAENEIPINPSGGLKSKGHPIGATGIGQVVEVFEQFDGQSWRKKG